MPAGGFVRPRGLSPIRVHPNMNIRVPDVTQQRNVCYLCPLCQRHAVYDRRNLAGADVEPSVHAFCRDHMLLLGGTRKLPRPTTTTTTTTTSRTAPNSGSRPRLIILTTLAQSRLVAGTPRPGVRAGGKTAAAARIFAVAVTKINKGKPVN